MLNRKNKQMGRQGRLSPAVLAAVLFAAGSALLLVPAAYRPAQAAARRGRQAPQTLVIEGHRAAADASISTKAMRYLPFDVPPGVTRIRIHREFTPGSETKRRNTCDFGLWDNRGTDSGFRGWQGGSPGDFVLTGDYVTCSPHAVPGPIPAGRWYIAQYYLASVPEGLGYKYTVTFDFDGPKPPDTFPAPPPYRPGVLRAGPGWFAGNLHCHSIHSDGTQTFSDLIGHCADAGFDFVVSTEHNSPTAHFRFPEAAKAHPGVLLLYGDEFTSPFGHAGIIGEPPGAWFDFRIDGGDGRLPSVITDAHRQGALFVVNHPFALCTTCSWRYPSPEWDTVDAVEVWNGAWTLDDRAAVNLWDKLLKAGRHVWAYGGTDYHKVTDPLTPAAFVHADSLSTAAIMDGLRHGHVTLSESPHGPRVSLTAFADPSKIEGDTVTLPPQASAADLAARITAPRDGAFDAGTAVLHLVWSDGETRLPLPALAAGASTTLRYSVPVTTSGTGDVGYIRAELLRVDAASGGGEKMAALTNPIFFARR